MDEDVSSGRRMFGCSGVAEFRHKTAQVQLQPLMLRARRTTTTVRVGRPVIAGDTDRLELEDPGVVLVAGVLVRDQLNVTARLRTDEWRTGLVPDECPVTRITDPQRR